MLGEWSAAHAPSRYKGRRILIRGGVQSGICLCRRVEKLQTKIYFVFGANKQLSFRWEMLIPRIFAVIDFTAV